MSQYGDKVRCDIYDISSKSYKYYTDANKGMKELE